MPKSNAPQHVKRRREAFLAAYAESGNVSLAARTADVDRCTHYKWLEDVEYAAAFAQADAQAGDALEAEARRRALCGVEEPAGWYQGSPGGTVTKYSDTLLIFLLKGRKPDVYGDKQRVEHTGKDGAPLRVEIIGG